MTRAKRKQDHIKHALQTQDQISESFFDSIHVIHQSVTNVNWEKVSLEVEAGELLLSSPLFVNAMTGGGGLLTEKINQQLAIASRETGITLAVGSQMSALKDSTEQRTFQIVRKENPNGIIFANIGAEATIEEANRVVDMIEANAIQIHLNTLQELLMPEGDRSFEGHIDRIQQIVENVGVPVIVKEVGYGISKETAKKLKDIGVTYCDVGGMGGTNFSRVENLRRQTPLTSYENWGIPTPISILETTSIFEQGHVFASGGIRNGLDGAKALILGAKAFGMAGILLKTLTEDGVEGLIHKIRSVHEELKIAMVLLNCYRPLELKGQPVIFLNDVKDWLEQRKIL
ncbi:type 2 isopentenyl-diphosphate Delta-isomerase [Bacillaceae bacterium S4-13-58]